MDLYKPIYSTFVSVKRMILQWFESLSTSIDEFHLRWNKNKLCICYGGSSGSERANKGEEW